MEATTIQKYIHTSPRKLRLVADVVRKMSPNKAIDVLAVTNKYAAKDLLKSISTAVSNATALGVDSDKITFKKIEINEGPRMKRYRAGTRGRARPYTKKMSHIKIVLTDELKSKAKSKNSKLQLKIQKEKGGNETAVAVDNSADSAK